MPCTATLWMLNVNVCFCIHMFIYGVLGITYMYWVDPAWGLPNGKCFAYIYSIYLWIENDIQSHLLLTKFMAKLNARERHDDDHQYTGSKCVTSCQCFIFSSLLSSSSVRVCKQMHCSAHIQNVQIKCFMPNVIDLVLVLWQKKWTCNTFSCSSIAQYRKQNTTHRPYAIHYLLFLRPSGFRIDMDMSLILNT